MKKSVIFKDAEGNKVVFDAEVKTGKDNKLIFSASGEYCGSLGQCFDHVKPRTELQTKLINIWRNYHLNDMNAGTVAQDECIKNSGYDLSTYKDHGHSSSYEFACRILEVNGLLVDNGYKYGSAWLYRSLPENFESDLIDLMDAITEEEEAEKERPVNENDINLFSDFNNPECALAIALMSGLCVNEIEDIIEDSDNRWTVQGVDYLAGDDSDMNEAWDDELEMYLEECILPDVPDHIRNYFDSEAWKRDARYDGRGHALNRYNGREEEQTVNGTTYYAYRQ